MTETTQSREERLLVERELGQSAQRAHANFIEPFYNAKLDEIFNAFCAARIGDAETLVNIHHMYKSLEALQKSTAEAVETGKLAEYSLQEMQKQQNPEKVF